jgi:phosphate transport system substrate-binding protein
MFKAFMTMTVAAVALATAAAPEGDETTSPLDRELPKYEADRPVGGDLRSTGSDTMLNLLTQWGEGFRREHPSVRVQVEGKGSSTAPPALLENQAQFGPMSREMDDSEVEEFVSTFGYEPTGLRVAIDCVAVYVHRDNPIEELSLDDLEKIFTVAGGQMTWGQLGVTDTAWRDRPVSLYGRNSASGTYKFFKKYGCGGSDFKPTVKEQPGSSGVIQGVSTDRFGIGYSGVGYKTPDVKFVKIAAEDGEEAFGPTVAAANAGDYPLARFLLAYTNYDRRVGLDPLRAEFVRFIFSRDGQEQVLKDGAYPVTAEIAREELEAVGLEPGF